MALTRGGYPLGSNQQDLTDGVRRYYERQQDDRNLLLGESSGIVNHHFGIGRVDRAGDFEDLSQSELAEELHRLELNEIDALIAQMGPVAPDARVLDAGCGRGGTAFSIAQRTGARVEAVTVSPYQRAFAARLAKEHGLEDRVHFHEMDYLALDFPEGHFDHVITNESTQYVVEIGDLIREVHRVLRPGGRYTCATWCANEDFDGDNPHVEAIDLHYGTSINRRRDYLDALAELGFAEPDVEDLTELATPYWELRCHWQHRSGVELDFLLGHRSRRILYLLLGATRT